MLSPNGHVEHHLVLADLGGHHLGRRRARHRGGAARLPRADAVPAPRRAGAGDRRLGGADASWARRPRRSSTAAGLPASRRPSTRSPPLDGGFVRRMPADRRRRRGRVRPRRPACRARGRGRPRSARRRWPGSPPTRRCGSRPAVPGSASTPTTARSRTSCRGCAPPSTWTRAATAARRRSPACTTSAGRRGGWCCCTWTASARCWPSRGRRCWPAPARSAGSARVVRHYELGVIALALVKQSVAVDAALTVAGSTAAIDPDDAPAEPDDTLAAARERVRAVRSATIGR